VAGPVRDRTESEAALYRRYRHPREVRRWLNAPGPCTPPNLVPKDVPLESWWLLLRSPHPLHPGSYVTNPPEAHPDRESAYASVKAHGARLVKAALRSPGGFLIAEIPESVRA
jgi:hypothetical protein